MTDAKASLSIKELLADMLRLVELYRSSAETERQIREMGHASDFEIPKLAIPLQISTVWGPVTLTDDMEMQLPSGEWVPVRLDNVRLRNKQCGPR